MKEIMALKRKSGQVKDTELLTILKLKPGRIMEKTPRGVSAQTAPESWNKPVIRLF